MDKTVNKISFRAINTLGVEKSIRASETLKETEARLNGMHPRVLIMMFLEFDFLNQEGRHEHAVEQKDHDTAAVLMSNMERITKCINWFDTLDI